MKVAILISGFLRTIKNNFKKTNKVFGAYDIDYYLHLSNNEKMDRYNNESIDHAEIINIIKPIEYIIEDEKNFDNINYKNQKNMWYKIYLLNQLKCENENKNKFTYDIVIRIRPDLFILDECIDINNFVFNNTTIYGSYIDTVFSDEFNFGSSKAMDKYADLFLQFDIYNTKNIKRPEDFLKLHCNSNELKMIHSNIKHKLILTLCNIIAITGPSGSGKTTLMKNLEFLFLNNVLKIEGDRYHKWERNDKNWENYTHLNPQANYISKFCDDVYNLKIGNDIYQVDYDHSNGKFTEVEKLENKDNIILCGLHTLFDKNTNKLFNFKIYLDTDEELRIFWKTKRDSSCRGHCLTNIIKSIESRKEDYIKFIKPQINNSDLIIKFFSPTTDDKIIVDQIHLELLINKKCDIKEFIKKLNFYKIHYFYEKKKYCKLTFINVQNQFEQVLNNLLLLSGTNQTGEVSYYTIITSLIIFLLNKK